MYWYRLPRAAVDASFQEVFKVTLDVAQGNLTWWVVSSPGSRKLNPDDLYGHFQLKPFCDSMIYPNQKKMKEVVIGED